MNIKSIATMAVLSAAATMLTQGCCCQPVKKDIAIQMYSMRADIKKDYDGTIDKLGKMGYTAVEVAGYGNGKFYGKEPADFKADIDKTGMKIISSHTARRLSPEEIKTGNFSEAMKFWDTAIAAHKAIGAKYLVAPWMPVPKSLKELDVWCKYYNEIGKRCKDAGIKFGYHNHAFEFQKIEDKMMYDYMLENTNPEYVFFQMDVYWVVRGQKAPVDYFKKYPGRFKVLHIKDERELGQSGMVGFDAIFSNVDIAGTEAIVVEVERYSYEPEKSVKMSFDYLNKAEFVPAKYGCKKACSKN